MRDVISIDPASVELPPRYPHEAPSHRTWTSICATAVCLLGGEDMPAGVRLNRCALPPQPRPTVLTMGMYA